MYPWSYTTEKLPDWQELHSVGVVIANAIEAIGGLPYWVRSLPIILNRQKGHLIQVEVSECSTI